jgi:AAA domain
VRGLYLKTSINIKNKYMPIYKKDQSLPTQPVIVLIYGEPGVSKTSLSNTCANPLNIDFDRGFKRSVGRPDVLMPSGWKEVEDELANGTFDTYSTIVPDTAKGALDDFLMAYVVEKDYKLKTNKLKAFGELGEQFKLFVNQLRLKGKDLFIIAHAKNQEDGDIVKKVPDVTGQSSALLLRIADQVGYMSMRNGKRVLSFNPTDTTVGKNVAGLKDIELPLHTSPEWNGFADREIICKVKESLATMSEEQRESLNFIAKWHEAIDAVKIDDAGLKAISTDISKVTEEHLKKQVRAYLSAHLKKVGWKWDAPNKVFIPIEPPAAVAETAKDEIDLKSEAEAQRDELNGGKDLFAKAE